MQTVKVEKVVTIKLMHNGTEMPNISMPPLIVAKLVAELCLGGKKVSAIMILRECYGYGLLEAKTVCDAIVEIYHNYPQGNFPCSLVSFYTDCGLPRV